MSGIVARPDVARDVLNNYGNTIFDQASRDLTGVSGFDLREPSYTTEVNSMRNTISNISTTASSFNSAFSTALNERHNDDFHGDSKFFGSNSYSNGNNGCELI
ncbi:MAG: hypothetical protein U1E31_02340 [Rickettsiales bacterium]